MSDVIIRAILFSALVPLTDLSLKWIWKAVYRSSYKRESDIERYKYENMRTNSKNSGINSWLIDTSPNPHKTQLLIFAYYILLLPALAGMALSHFGVFTTAFDSALKILSYIVPSIFAVSLIIGFIYKKTAKELDFSKIETTYITSYESQMLADNADNWESGEFKNKFRYKPSDLPKYIFIILWITGLVSMIVFAYTNSKTENITEAQTTQAVTEEESSKIESVFNNPLAAEIKAALEEQNMLVVGENSEDKFSAYKDNEIILDFFLFDDSDSAYEKCMERIEKNATGKENINETPRGINYSHEKDERLYFVACVDEFVIEVACPSERIPDTAEILEILENIFDS